MNIAKILPVISAIKKIVSIMQPVFFAMIGGFVVSTMNRCSEQKPVNLIVTNQVYESQIKDLQRGQDSLRNVLPTPDEANGYLSKRYPTTDPKPVNR